MIFHGIHEFSEFFYFREFEVLYLKISAGPSRIPANSLNFPGLCGNCQAGKKFLAVHLSIYVISSLEIFWQHGKLSPIYLDISVLNRKVQCYAPGQFFWKICFRHIVRYHSGGSMKLNACILLLAHMVYL